MELPKDCRGSAEFVFPGSMYLYRAEKVFCRFQAALRDPIDPQLLQQALDAVLARAAFFRVELVESRREFLLAENTRPCRVFAGLTQRNIPDETDGYLFCVCYEGDTLALDWFHFLTDGFGAKHFMGQLLLEYCARRYGSDLRSTGQELISSPMYSLDELLARAEASAADNTMQQKVTRTSEGELRRLLLRADKDDLVRAAQRLSVRPFVCLLGLLSLAVRACVPQEKVVCSYSFDTRQAAGVPHALYNCVASIGQDVQIDPESRLADFISDLNERVNASLEPEAMRERMAQQWSWVHRVSQMDAPLRIKKRVYQMGEYASGFPSDFWLSYLGSPLFPALQPLADYLTDFQVWVPPEGASLCVEEVTLHDRLILCIQDKSAHPGLRDALCRVFAREGIRLYGAEELPPMLTS